jgi:enoyl-CoA hydratase/carnithine racemase
MTVSVSIDDDGVADVRLNRPDKLNALDLPTLRALADAGEALAGDARVRAVVLSGEGRSFSAGLDLTAFVEGLPTRHAIMEREPGRITNLGQQAAHVWRELPQPVIAAVHGHALGGGLQIALAADIRLVAPDATLSVLEIRWGLVPDMTGTTALVRLVGEDVAKELTFTGRMIPGTEAVHLGLATRLSDTPHTAASELARELTTRSPEALRAAKRLLNRASDHDLATQFLAESQALADLRGTPNQTEAAHAYFENRPPTFT